MTNSIFISIASYRDPELVPTVLDCLEKSKYPDNLYFGICWQHDDKEDISKLSHIKNLRLIDIDWRDSQGACWSRHHIQKNLFDNQKYYLQLDSHHRFIKNWDEVLLDLIDYAKLKSTKPIIGTYGTTYWQNTEITDFTPYKINTFESFGSDGDIISRPSPIKNPNNLKDILIPARLLSGHFIFSDGNFVNECMYDPNLYFRGEELTLSARAYTHGYDMYHPTKTIIWHEYLRPSQHKHWLDHTKKYGFIIEGEDRNIKSKTRQRKLFNMEENNDINFGKYGLGSERPLHEYELYCGLDFKNRKVHKFATDLREDSPMPYVMSEDEWLSGMLQRYELDIKWDLSEIPRSDDYDFWFFGFEDNNGKLLARNDFKNDNPSHKKIIDRQINSYKAVIFSEDKPTRCIILPHSSNNGWQKKLVIQC